MNKLMVLTGIVFLFFSCVTKQQDKVDFAELGRNITKLDNIADKAVHSYLDDIPADSLHNKIMERHKRYVSNDSMLNLLFKDYPIEFLKEDGDFEFEFFNIPNFELAKGKTPDNSFKLVPDSMFVHGFILYEDQPFAEISLRFDELRNKYMLKYIQRATKDKWLSYKTKTENGNTVFECTLKLKSGDGYGTLFLPYIFFTNEKQEITAITALKHKELTIDEVVKKHLK